MNERNVAVGAGQGRKNEKNLYRNKNSIKGYGKLQHYNLIFEKGSLANC